MAKFILNKGFNHVENGQIERFEAGADVSHLPEKVTKKLVEGGHIESKVDKKSEAGMELVQK